MLLIISNKILVVLLKKGWQLDIGSFIYGVVVSLVATFIAFLVKKTIENRRRLALLCSAGVHRNEEVRVSTAYLFRIVIDGKYLLIRGGRIRSQYQPVGGVYKYFPSSKAKLDSLGARADCALNTHLTDSDDLRLRLPGKNLLKFLDWFDGRTGREVETMREFREELVEPGYLADKAVKCFNPAFIRMCDRKMSYSKELEIYELLIHDVYEVTLPMDEAARIREAIGSGPDCELVLVDARDIEKGTVEISGVFYGIAPTARKVL